MKSISILVLLICFILLGNSCSNAQNVSESTFGFDDLNNDVLLDIFDTLGFEDLLLLADVNSKYRALIARHHIMNKFRIHERILKVKAQKYHSVSNKTKVEFYNDSIMINDYVVLLRILRNFGHLIPRIFFKQIDRTANSSIWYERVFGYINEYCSDSLNELLLKGESFSLNSFQKPFKKLNKFLINAKTISSDRSLNEMFPSMKYLGIRNIELSENQEILKQHFPHLMYVTLPDMYGSEDMFPHRNEFNKYILELNPQIRSFQTIFVDTKDDYDLLRNMSEKMPHLETIHIWFTENIPRIEEDNNIEPINFENVRKCFLVYNVIPNLIRFDQLEEITTMGLYGDAGENATNWIQLVTKHRKLKVLNKWKVLLSLQQYNTIIENLPDLVEISTYYAGRGIDWIFDLMMRDTKLKRIVIYTDSYTDSFWLNLNILKYWKIESDLIEMNEELMQDRRFTGGGFTSYYLGSFRKIKFVKI